MAARAGRGSGRGQASAEAGRAGGRRGPAGPRNLAGPLKRYYSGEPVPCPVGCGGLAQVVRRATRDDDGAELWFECESCAQRERYDVPGPTAGERTVVLEAVADAKPPACPRHAAAVVLDRQGRRLVCPDCGILFRE